MPLFELINFFRKTIYVRNNAHSSNMFMYSYLQESLQQINSVNKLF